MSEWISVYDRNPKHTGTYLVFDGRIWFCNYSTDAETFDDDYGWRITHWMPIPDPPNGSDE